MIQIKLFTKLFFYTFLAITFLEVVSFYAYFNPLINNVGFFLIVLIALILSLRKIEYGLYLILAELFIGSKGYLFSFDFQGVLISIRIGLFLVILVVWLLKLIKNRDFVFKNSPLFRWYLILFLFIIWGLINGYLNKNSLANIFFDFNGWLYFLMIFAFFSALTTWEKIQSAFQVIFAASFYLILKTVALLYLFSHQISYLLPSLYKWVRQTGVGEITHMPNNFYRIFFQSHIYIVCLFFLIALLLISFKRKDFCKKDYLGFWLLGLFSTLVIFTSYSRSFWLGALFGLVGLYYLIFFILKLTMKKAFLVSILLLITIFTAYFLAYGIVKLPWPKPSAITGGLIEERTKDITTEAGSISRFQLLSPLIDKIKAKPIFGSGFGTTITYQTKDPRYLAIHPDGIYTTYAFEWGYLDIWVKIGLFGLLAYLTLIYQFFRLGRRIFTKITNPTGQTLTLGLLLGLFLLVMINVTTPYLNHPLGIGYLLLVTAIFQTMEKDKTGQTVINNIIHE